MSHHLDSPIARQDVRLDIADLYVFRGQVGTVLVINVCHSLGAPKIPGYHPEGMYEFKVDLNGDAVEEVTYRLMFDERDEHGTQRYTVRRISGIEAVDPHAAGMVIGRGTTDEAVTTPSGVRAWAGHAGDPFWIEPDVLHAVGHAFQDGTKVDLASWDPRKARNLFAGQTVYSIVLELPDGEFIAGAGEKRRIGVWAVATLATDAGGWRSINRIGLPMIPPLFAQYNEDLGDGLNAGRPADDFAPGEKLSLRRSQLLLRHMERLKILTSMERRLRTACSPTCSLIRSAHMHRLALMSGTVVPSLTMRPTSCFPPPQMLPYTSGSERNRSRQILARRSLRSSPSLNIDAR